MNVLSINVSTVSVLWLLGYRPSEWDGASWSPSTLRAYAPAAATVFGLLVAFAGAGVVVGAQIQTANVVNDEVSETLNAEPYRAVRLREVSVEFDTGLRGTTERTVSVTVARPADERYPDLATTLDRRLTRALDQSVSVDLTVVPRRSTGHSPS